MAGNNINMYNKSLREMQDLLDAITKQLAAIKKQSEVLKDAPTPDLKGKTQVTKELTALNKELVNLEKAKVQLQKELIKLQELKKKAVNDTSAAESKKAREAIALEKARNSLLAQRQAADKKIIAEREKARKQVEKDIEAIKKENKALENNNDAFKKLSRERNKAQAEFKKMAAQFGENSKQAQKAKIAFDKLEKSFSSINKAAKDGRPNVGRYGSAFDGIGKSVLNIGAKLGGIGIAIAGVGRTIMSVLNTSIQFQKELSKLGAITGKTAKENESLIAEIKRVGATSAFTAVEVTQLSIELGKLGFSSPEIQDSIQGVAALAAATGSTLADAAAVGGATLRGFGLDAAEMGRVTDVMAKSFSSSALDLSKFRESMKYVAPVAKAAGVSLEETTAMLASLADQGISGSQAGTALRRILADMNKTGKSTGEALGDLAKKGLNLEDAFDEVGRSAQTSLLVLADSVGKTDELTESFKDAEGAAQEMADTMLNNLAGDITKASSAWEGFILGLDSGDGVISRTIRKAVQGFTDLIGKISELNKTEADKSLEEFTKESTTELLRLQEKKFKTNEYLINQEKELLKLHGEVKAGREMEVSQDTRDFFEMMDLELDNTSDIVEALKSRKAAMAGNIAEEKIISDILRARLAEEEKAAVIAEIQAEELAESTAAKKESNKEAEKEIDIIKERASLGFEYEQMLLKIRNYQEALDKGIITTAEFAEKKNNLLFGGDDVDMSDLDDFVNELNDRTIAANEEITAIMDSQAVRSLETNEEKVKKLIEIEDRKRIKLLQNENLLKEERKLIILKSEEEILRIKEEYSEEGMKFTEKQLEQLQIINDFVFEGLDLFTGAISERLDREKEALDAEKSLVDERLQLRQDELSALQEKQAELEESGAAGLQNEIALKQAEIAAEKKAQAELIKEQEKAAQKRKRLAIAEASINYGKELAAIALYSAQQPANVPTAGVFGVSVYAIQSALATARYLVSLNNIRNTKFADGGIAVGNSHAEGGIPFTIAGQGGYEMEGGEYIVNKKSTKEYLPILESINNNNFELPLKNIIFAETDKITEAYINNKILEGILAEQRKANERPLIYTRGSIFKYENGLTINT